MENGRINMHNRDEEDVHVHETTNMHTNNTLLDMPLQQPLSTSTMKRHKSEPTLVLFGRSTNPFDDDSVSDSFIVPVRGVWAATQLARIRCRPLFRLLSG
jgi:hypothetical protein